MTLIVIWALCVGLFAVARFQVRWCACHLRAWVGNGEGGVSPGRWAMSLARNKKLKKETVSKRKKVNKSKKLTLGPK
jgi:hypothetical protein